MPDPLYTGKIDSLGANVRDLNGVVVGKLIPDTPVWVYEIATIAGWHDRAVIDPVTRNNIWATRIIRDVAPIPIKQGDFDSPVGTVVERMTNNVPPGAWVDSNPYGSRYTDSGGNLALHTGADLNLNSPAWDSDMGAPVYACSGGVVRYAGWLGYTWSRVVIAEHQFVTSRYAHLATMAVRIGQTVMRGDLVGTIGRPGGGPYHLHFDISPTKKMIIAPGDWPGLDIVRLHRDYIAPLEFIKANRPEK